MKCAINKYFLVVIVVFFLGCSATAKSGGSLVPTRIGYFHGGRTVLLYRAFLADYFEKEGVPISLFSKGLKERAYSPLPKTSHSVPREVFYGKVTGEELIEEVMKGDFDGAAVGEGSFIAAAAKGLPIVAVAELGHDNKDKPAHAIVFRKDVVINKPEDIKGKVLMSRRAGPGEKIFLLEFLRSVGLTAKDVTIVDDVGEDEMKNSFKNKRFDGGYYHYHSVVKQLAKKQLYIYRKLDWMNPEMSSAFLIFRKEYVARYPERVEGIVRAYMKRIKYEYGLSAEKRTNEIERMHGNSPMVSYYSKTDSEDMGYPQYDFPPFVAKPLLDEMQDLLLKYGDIEKKADLGDYIDNRFIAKISKEFR